jgi:hypothetical protein
VSSGDHGGGRRFDLLLGLVKSEQLMADCSTDGGLALAYEGKR